jgi:hypothetical protein
MSKPSLAGAAALLAAPPTVIVGVLLSPTLSDDAAPQVAAFRSHHDAMVAGALLQGISIVLLIAGAGWFAAWLAPRARTLAIAGGMLAVLGSLPVVYDDGVHAAVAAVATGLGSVQATVPVDQILSSAGVKAVEPFSLLGDLGLALLGVAATRAGAPRWTAAAIVLGAFGEGAGFATGTRALVVAAFALLFAGLSVAVKTLAAPEARAAFRLDAQSA